MGASAFSDGRWELSQEAFDRLLGFLSPDTDEAGRKYEEIRLRLIKIFTCRGSATPEDLTDETMNRVARKVAEIAESYVGDPRLFFYGVARKVFLESVRKKPKALPMPEATPTEEEELNYECLERCMQNLTPRNHELILEYYRWEEGGKQHHRKELAERLGIAANALRIRAHRIRNSLQKCVFTCLEHNARV